MTNNIQQAKYQQLIREQMTNDKQRAAINKRKIESFNSIVFPNPEDSDKRIDTNLHPLLAKQQMQEIINNETFWKAVDSSNHLQTLINEIY